ncbi:neutral alpha glucosidase AB [Echinococcus multilocularis]|uniref:Glucosidase II subunit alpha n=1 Tax=Echinococcus multilocularis TaxID=6211 RepID=A0A068Y8P5_ECHMU|nr:neutral alpha glucosidase AB [Echinococcus multilocularis]
MLCCLQMWFLWLILLINGVLCVDRSNFRTCAESSFCVRQRAFWPSAPKYSVDIEKLRVDESVQFQVIDSESQKRLNVNITYHPNHTFRLVFDEFNPIRPRFRPRIGDSLVSEPKTLPLDVHRTGSEVILSGEYQDRAVIGLSPFRVLFFSNGVHQVTVNERDLLNFEHQLEQQFEERPIVVEATSEDGTGSESNNSDMAQNNKVLEPPPTERVPVDWSESFKGHRDSRPHGPTSVGIDFTFHGFEYVYGIPEHADSLALRNTNQTDPYRLYNLDVFEYELNNPMALYGSVPLMWAHKASSTVGVFIDNPSEAWIDVESSREVNSVGGLLSNLFAKAKNPDPLVKTRWMFETGVLDIFIILADDPQSGLRAYAGLTGSTPLPPLFALAHHQCRWNYRDQGEMKSINHDYNKHNLPMDVLWLDIEYANDKRYLTWNAERFPSPDDIVDDLGVSGRKLVVVVDPHIKADHSWPTCSQARSEGFFVKNVNSETDFDGWCWPGSSYWPDFYRPEVVDWWANLFTSGEFLSKDRMFYSWNDMNEPSVFSGAEVTIPKDTIFGGVWENRDLHNLYSLWVHNATWEGLLRRSNRKERPFVLSRGFYAGSQRTAAVWTGDNSASWDHLQICTPMLLSMSLAGLTFCGADVGGFFGHPSGELYTRWYQAAAFHPFLRSHAHIDTPKREPWNYEQKYLDAIREALRLRYSLLPYWYTLFARSEVTSLLPMAPLFYYFPTDENSFSIDDAFMVGEGLLVHPVVQEGASSVDVYLPEGTWYLHDDWRVYSGGQVVQIPVDLRTIPLFYRGGYIIPKKARPRRSSAMMLNDPYTIVVALDQSTERTDATGYLYLDDFHSLDRSQARLYQMNFFRENHSYVFEFTLLQGHNDVITPYIERIVLLGAQMARPRRVILTTALEPSQRREVEFFYSPPEMHSSTTDGNRSALLVIRKPEVRAMTGWRLLVQLS